MRDKHTNRRDVIESVYGIEQVKPVLRPASRARRDPEIFDVPVVRVKRGARSKQLLIKIPRTSNFKFERAMSVLFGKVGGVSTMVPGDAIRFRFKAGKGKHGIITLSDFVPCSEMIGWEACRESSDMGLFSAIIRVCKSGGQHRTIYVQSDVFSGEIEHLKPGWHQLGDTQWELADGMLVLSIPAKPIEKEEPVTTERLPKIAV